MWAEPMLKLHGENADNNDESKTHPASVSINIFTLVLLLVVLHMFNMRLYYG